MSEDNVPETGPISVDDVLAAIQQQNVGRARAMFDDVMQQKVADRLDAEKVKVADTVFNNTVEVPEPGIVDMDAIAAAGEESEEPTSEQEEFVPEDEEDLESEIENAFESELD